MKRAWKSTINWIVLYLQWFPSQGIIILSWLGDKKRSFPNLFGKGLRYLILPFVVGVFTFLGLKENTPPDWWHTKFSYLERMGVRYAAAWSFAASFFAEVGGFIIARALLPLLIYVPHAVAMRSMGLVEASVKPGGMDRIIRRLLKFHKDEKPIRVMCISGKNLFVKKDDPPAPLRSFAESGKLQVLMPKSNVANPTVKNRYETYNREFRASAYPQIGDLLREINISKEIIKGNVQNQLWEHDVLCMWRVVLLSNHCVVQNYFPNHGGCHSDSSPVFVFEKEEDCPYSYYETFEKMFELISKDSKERAGDDTQQTFCD